MHHLTDLIAQIFRPFMGEISSKVQAFLLAIAIAGLGFGGWKLGVQAEATFTHEPAVATIIASGYRCPAANGALRACSQRLVDQLKASNGQPTDFRVTFAFADASGRRHTITGYITRTGLPRAEAVPGATFNLLYDPADPSKTSLPLGADYHAILIGLAGVAALAFYVALFGSPFRRRRSPEIVDGIYAG